MRGGQSGQWEGCGLGAGSVQNVGLLLLLLPISTADATTHMCMHYRHVYVMAVGAYIY